MVAVLVIFALAYFLNRIRASESTGMSLAFPAMQLPLKFYMMSVVGAYVGLFFEDMTGSWGMLFVGMAGGAFVTACVTEIVYDMDFHSLFCHWKSTVVYAVAAAVVLGVLALDVMGWNRSWFPIIRRGSARTILGIKIGIMLILAMIWYRAWMSATTRTAPCM